MASFMTVAVLYGPAPWFHLAASSTPANGSLQSILAAATELLTWFITSMGSLLTFIVGNPVVLMMFLILLVGSVVAMLMRVWHSA